MAYMRDRGHTRVEPTPEAEREWLAHVHDTGRRMLFTQVDSWMMASTPTWPEGQAHVHRLCGRRAKVP